MTTRRHIGGVVLAVAAVAGSGDGSAQGTGAPDSPGASRRSDMAALQMQMFEATRRSNELAAEQNRQTKKILEQTNALVDASARQSDEAEQTRQLAEASMTQNLQALDNMKTLVSRTLETAQSRKVFMERVFLFWSAVLALFIVVAAYFSWRERRNMRQKVAQTVDEIRNVGLAEMQKVVADLKAEKQLLLGEVARQKEALTKKATES